MGYFINPAHISNSFFVYLEQLLLYIPFEHEYVYIRSGEKSTGY